MMRRALPESPSLALTLEKKGAYKCHIKAYMARVDKIIKGKHCNYLKNLCSHGIILIDNSSKRAHELRRGVLDINDGKGDDSVNSVLPIIHGDRNLVRLPLPVVQGLPQDHGTSEIVKILFMKLSLNLQSCRGQYVVLLPEHVMIRFPDPGHDVEEVTEVFVEALLEDTLDLEHLADEIFICGLDGPEDGRSNWGVFVQARLVGSS